MKIVGIFGSIRPNGNTDWMVNKVLDSAKERGADVDKIVLRDFNNIEFCRGCDACFSNGGNCVITDDMRKIYPKLLNSDVIVVGCPNYFKNVSALTKNFMDRTNAFVRVKKEEKRRLEGKYAVGLCVGGEEIEDTQYCEDALVRFFRAHRMKILSMVKARADKPNEISGNIELSVKLTEIGRKLATNDVQGMTYFR